MSTQGTAFLLADAVQSELQTEPVCVCVCVCVYMYMYLGYVSVCEGMSGNVYVYMRGRARVRCDPCFLLWL